MQQRARVTAADIARLAGVGRAAVSNWRKRYDSFPAPIGGTAASPQFDLDQVEQWLAEQGKLPSVADEDRLWRSLLAAAGDPAEALAAAGDHLRGGRPLPYANLRPQLDALAEKDGTRAAFEQLWQRFADLPGQRSASTPEALADLMVTLAQVGGGTVLDPACGTGRLLRAAAKAGATGLYGQDNDVAATRLASLWLAMNELPGDIRTGDSLRQDDFPDLVADAVVGNLPFGLTNWGHEELGYDRRWGFGVPPRTEPELAWVQHAIAHLKPGGSAVLLMPPSAASRRAGRRIRAELLRRGALRAIVALPPGAAAPHAIGLHLWVLRHASQAAADVLMVDVAAEALDEAYLHIVDAFKASEARAHSVPVIELLDEEVDLTPTRHTGSMSMDVDPLVAFHKSRERLIAVVDMLPGLLPSVVPTAEPTAPMPAISLGDLARAGQVQLIGPVRTGGADAEPAGRPVLTGDDVVNGGCATGRADLRILPRIELRRGDIVVPTSASQLHARVITEEGSLLGRGLALVRCDPAALDPWFLAGYLRAPANERRASVSSGSGLRFDPRRAQVPRIPLTEQRRHGAVFRRLQHFDDAIREAATLSGDISRRTAEAFAGGRLTIDGQVSG